MSTRDLQRSRRVTVPAMLTGAAARAGARAALVFGDAHRTFAELDARVDRLASALAARGVRPGDRVAVVLHNGLEIVEAFLGCQRAGACPVPVNFRLVADEIAFILQDAGAVGVITGDPLTATVREAVGDGWVLSAGGEYEALLAEADPRPPDVLVAEDGLAFLLYTSGTTGRPKGARLTHRNLVFSTHAWTVEIGATADDVWLTGQPLFHIGGINGVLPFLNLGRTSVLLPTTGFDPVQAIAALRRHRVTRCVFVPTQWGRDLPPSRRRPTRPRRAADGDPGRLRWRAATRGPRPTTRRSRAAGCTAATCCERTRRAFSPSSTARRT